MIYHLVQPNKDSDSKVKYLELFDPPGLFHVGQKELPNGNCYEHHLRMNETPCTPPKEVELNEKMREQKWKEVCKQRKEIKKSTKKEKWRQDRWDREFERFKEWQKKWGFNYRE
jgi:hypothetical protein